MNHQDAERRAFELHSGGFNCAESVLTAVLEQLGVEAPALVPRIATCFGGGVGRTKEEICGALTGALMAMGYAMGRSVPGANWDEAARAATEMRERFSRPFGSTRCKDILAVFGPEEASARCHRLSGSTAALACELLKQS